MVEVRRRVPHLRVGDADGGEVSIARFKPLGSCSR